MDHSVMFLVLCYLAESGPAKNREIAESLQLELKHASMVLLRCFRRGLVDKHSYRYGKERGYIYSLTDKGAEWMLYKASKKEKDTRCYGPQKEIVNERVQQPIFIVLNKEPQSLNYNALIAFCATALAQAQNRLIQSSTINFLIWKRFVDVTDACDLCIYQLFMRPKGDSSTTPAMKLLIESWAQGQGLFRDIVRSMIPMRKPFMNTGFRQDFELRQKTENEAIDVKYRLNIGKTASPLNERLRREKDARQILELFLLVRGLRAQVPVNGKQQLTEEEIEALCGRFKRLLEELWMRLSSPSYHANQMPTKEPTTPKPARAPETDQTASPLTTTIPRLLTCIPNQVETWEDFNCWWRHYH